jgi:hypothetical protein
MNQRNKGIIPRSPVLLEKLIVLQLVKKCPAFYSTWWFNTVSTTAHSMSLSGARLCPWSPIYLTLILLTWSIGWAPNSIPIYSYIQQDATLHSLFISGDCSTCFGCYFHPSSGAHTTVSTASGICHTITDICRYRGRVGTGLSVLWVAHATHRTLKNV